MKLRLLVIFWLSALTLCVHAQSTKKIKEQDPKNPVSKKYAVLKSDLISKHGSYTELYRLEVFTKGAYKNGLKTGSWSYFTANGKLEILANYKDGIRDGKWSYYYPNGKEKCTIYFNGGIPDSVFAYHESGVLSYEQKLNSNGSGHVKSFYPGGSIKQSLTIEAYQLSGACKVYFEHGQLHRHTDFKKGLPWTVVATNDENGNPVDGGNMTNGTGYYITFFHSGIAENQYSPSKYETFKNGKLDGLFESYNEPNSLSQTGFYESNYKIGEWVTYRGLDEAIEEFSIEQKVSNESPILTNPEKVHYAYYTDRTNVDMLPKYQEGLQGLMEFLGQNILYPYSARNAGISGTTYVSFLVDIEGSTCEPQIIQSPHKQLSEEALRVVKSLPRWIPGFQDNVPIPVQYNLPVKFSLR